MKHFLQYVYIYNAYIYAYLPKTFFKKYRKRRQYKRRFPSIAEQVMAFGSSTNLTREVKNKYRNCNHIGWRYFDFLISLFG